MGKEPKLLTAREPGDEIWVNEFTEESAQAFREALLEEAKGSSTRPIVIYIDSYGGYVDSLSKMIETMDEISNPLVTVAVGKAMSCGAVLLSHGDIRFCGKHARVMVHEVSGGAEGDVHDVHASTEELKRMNRWFNGLLAKNCGIAGGYKALRKLIKERDGRNMYMDADAALKFGIVDVIGMPRVGRLKLYHVEATPPKRPTGVKTVNGKKSETRSTRKRGFNGRPRKRRDKRSSRSIEQGGDNS